MEIEVDRWRLGCQSAVVGPLRAAPRHLASRGWLKDGQIGVDGDGDEDSGATGQSQYQCEHRDTWPREDGRVMRRRDTYSLRRPNDDPVTELKEAQFFYCF